MNKPNYPAWERRFTAPSISFHLNFPLLQSSESAQGLPTADGLVNSLGVYSGQWTSQLTLLSGTFTRHTSLRTYGFSEIQKNNPAKDMNWSQHTYWAQPKTVRLLNVQASQATLISHQMHSSSSISARLGALPVYLFTTALYARPLMIIFGDPTS